MNNGWKYPILMIHGRRPMEVIDSPSETYNSLGGHPMSFIGLGFFDASGGLWEITHIKVLGGRPPDNGWRFPWSSPPRFFARQLNYAMEAERVSEMNLSEVKEDILMEVEIGEFHYEALDTPEWKEKLSGYTTIEQIFDDFRGDGAGAEAYRA